MEVGQEAQALATVGNFVSPGNIEAILSKIDDPDELKRHYDNAGPYAIAALAMRCAAAARIYLLCKGYGNRAMEQVAKILEVSERTAQRLVQYWNECLKPIIDRDGDAAVFILEEGAWYSAAIAASPIVEKPPVELIDEATQKKAENPKYTPSMWRKDLGLSSDEGSTTSDAPSIIKQLRKIAKATEDRTALEDVALHLDGEKPKKAREILDTVRDVSVAVGELMGMLEERFGGRLE